MPRWIRVIARAGYAARGALYIIAGIAAARAARNVSDAPASSGGSLMLLHRTWLGSALAAIIILGLVGFSTWMCLRAILNADDSRPNLFGYLRRAGDIISGTVYLGLIAFGARVLFGHASGDTGGNQNAHNLSAVAMAHFMGRWLIAGFGAGFVIYGVVQLCLAARPTLNSRLDLHRWPAWARYAAQAVCRFGIATEGLVFMTVGLFLLLAGWRDNSNSARGLGGAIAAWRRGPHGAALLATVAAGLIAYGVYNLLLAGWRRLQ
jgi:hypothetical protein